MATVRVKLAWRSMSPSFDEGMEPTPRGWMRVMFDVDLDSSWPVKGFINQLVSRVALHRPFAGRDEPEQCLFQKPLGGTERHGTYRRRDPLRPPAGPTVKIKRVST